MADKIKDVVGNIYGNFIMRDLTYVSSGILVLTTLFYLLVQNPAETCQVFLNKPATHS